MRTSSGAIDRVPAAPPVCILLGFLALLLPAVAVAQLEFAPRDPLPAVIQARPGVADTLDLAGCVGLALERNERLLAERERRGEVEGQVYQALSTGLPSLDIGGSWNRGRDPSFALDETFSGGGGFGIPDEAPEWFQEWLAGFGSFIPAPGAIRAQSFLRANASVNWEINPIKISGALGAAKTGVERQNRLIQSAEYQVIEAVVTAYHGIIQAAENVQAVQAERANQRELLELVRMQFELGFAVRLDTLQAAVGLANLGPQLRVAEQLLQNRGAQLNALLRREPDDPVLVRNEQVIERETLSREIAIGYAMDRPDLQAVELFTDILRRNRRAQVADVRPYLSLFGTVGYVGRTADTVFASGHDYWTASVALTIPIFDGMLTRGRVMETDAQIRRNETGLSGQRRDVRVEVRRFIDNLEAARDVLDAAELNLVSSEEAFAESMLLLQLGKARYLDVLLAESNRVQARNNVIIARFEVLVQTAGLKRAIGYSPLVALRDIPGLVVEVSE